MADLIEENKALQAKLDEMQAQNAMGQLDDLVDQFEAIGDKALLVSRVDVGDSKVAKDLIYKLEKKHEGRSAVLLGTVVNEKPQLLLRISEPLNSNKELHAGNIVRKLAANIKGGGGGHPFFASAGGADANGIENASKEGQQLLREYLSH